MNTVAEPSGETSPRTTIEYVVLGLLAIQDPVEIHGYDLSKMLADGVLGQIVRVEPGMLYHYLKKLSRAGLISTRIARQTGRPDRQLHSLSESGSRHLHTWLSEPVRSTREIRLDFLLKLYFARRLDQHRAQILVTEQLAIMRARSERIRTHLRQAQLPTEDNLFGEAVLRLRQSQTDAALEWLEQLMEGDRSQG